MKDTNSNPMCYSRQLHGTYRLVNEKDEEKYNMTFYNGCPADIPWRGGNIDDIEIKKVSRSPLNPFFNHIFIVSGSFPKYDNNIFPVWAYTTKKRN